MPENDQADEGLAGCLAADPQRWMFLTGTKRDVAKLGGCEESGLISRLEVAQLIAHFRRSLVVLGIDGFVQSPLQLLPA